MALSGKLTKKLVEKLDAGRHGDGSGLNFVVDPSGARRRIVRVAAVLMPQYTPHSLRKTLVKFGDEKCTTMEEWKAWPMNLGHENMATTFNSYLPVSPERQMELIRACHRVKCRFDFGLLSNRGDS